ncbi:MAG: aspartyl protease family protein, partial [Candidatus Eisenbacteria bacterium]|nr:aspartyl protease family protein [Candidatus Eisenbacteria bacterium]
DPPEGGARDFAFSDGADRAEVPSRFIEDHMFVPVTIGGRESLWIIDSGASMSVIDEGYARELQLPLSGEIQAESSTGIVQLSLATLPPFAVGDIQFREQQVLVLDFVDLFRVTCDLEVLGILGYDFLSRFVARVDYANEMLTLYDSDSFAYAGSGTVLEAPLSDNLFRAEASVDGLYDGQWMLDLGAGGVSFQTPYAIAHGLGQRDAVLGVTFGAGGRTLHRRSRYESIEFGGYTVLKPEISTQNFDPDSKGEMVEGQQVGNLGNSLFRHFVLYLDYDRQQIIIEKGDDFGKDFPTDRSGLSIWRPEQACEVLYVSPGTPADEAGFREGDVVVAIDGIGVDRIGGLIEIRTLLREEPGTEHVFTVERDGERRELTLLLRDLFEGNEE